MTDQPNNAAGPLARFADWLDKGYLTDFGFQGRYVDVKPALVRAWLDGEIDSDEAILAAHASRNAGLMAWAGQLLAVQVTDPRSFVKVTTA